MLKIQELIDEGGQLVPVFLCRAGEELVLVEGAQRHELPDGAVRAAMHRYSAPFDGDANIAVIDQLALGDGTVLRHVRHLAGYDVVARDYLVLIENDRPLGCAFSTVVATALRHLARVAAAAEVELRATSP